MKLETTLKHKHILAKVLENVFYQSYEVKSITNFEFDLQKKQIQTDFSSTRWFIIKNIKKTINSNINAHYYANSRFNHIKRIISYVNVIHHVNSLSTLYLIENLSKKENLEIDCFLKIEIENVETIFCDKKIVSTIYEILNSKTSLKNTKLKGFSCQFTLNSYEIDLGKCLSKIKLIYEYINENQNEYHFNEFSIHFKNKKIIIKLD